MRRTYTMQLADTDPAIPIAKHKVVFKICGKCQKEYTEEAVRSLPYVGQQEVLEGDAPLKLYNCTCGTTLAIEN
jgi:hypothetical protein